MIRESKSRAARWCVIGLLLIMLVGYPLSLGPVLWLLDKPRTAPIAVYHTYKYIAYVYGPLFAAARSGPPFVRETLSRYARHWARRSTFEAIVLGNWCHVG